MGKGHGKACAKVILIGEHYVVYRIPALAIPVKSLCLEVTLTNEGVSSPSHELLQYGLALGKHFWGVSENLNAQVFSNIPIASGMGSSAALSVALGRAFCNLVGEAGESEKIASFSLEMEKKAHGRPSGIDTTVITYERPVLFQKGGKMEFWEGKGNLALLILSTGKPSQTRQMVEQVAQFQKDRPKTFEKLCQKADKVVQDFLQALGKGEIQEVSELANQFHELLKELEVSSPLLEEIRNKALQAGALGAKLSGGGGGGIVLAFSPLENAQAVKAKLEKQGVPVITEVVF